MEIITLVKQIAAPDGIPPTPVGNSTSPYHGHAMNPYDELAVEEGLRIKEKHGGTVTVISLGNSDSMEVVRTALAMGADRGIFIIDDQPEPLEGYDLALIFAHLLRPMPVDLILAGHRAVDDEKHIVGPALSEFLEISIISMVIGQKIKNGRIQCQRQLEQGVQLLEAPLPVLITTQQGLNTPRYITLPGIRRAKHKPLEIIQLEDIGIDMSRLGNSLRRIGSKRPERNRTQRIIVTGTAEEKTADLLNWLHAETKCI